MLIMTTKTKLYISAASLLIVAALVSVARRNNDPSGSQVRVADFSGANAGDSAASHPEAAGSFRTRVATREAPGHNGTHAPERLREFMLPQVVIGGLTLGEALRELLGVYEKTCGKTGESPLPLSFDLPPGDSKRLHLTLSRRDGAVLRGSIYFKTHCWRELAREEWRRAGCPRHRGPGILPGAII